MKEYYLELAGLRAVVRTPHPITISENLRPFLCQEHTQVACTITVHACRTLPQMAKDGVWNGPEYYDSVLGAMRVFHCGAPETAAFAVTELLESGDINICVLPEYLSYFTGSIGIFNRIGLETLLLQHQGLLLHASLIEYGGKSVAFAGPSGVGKSTQAQLWQNALGAQIINGDRTVLRKTQNTWTAYGSPYAGTSGIYKNQNAPLAAVVLLQRGQENELCQLSGQEAFCMLYPELSAHRWDKVFVERVTDLCLQLLTDVPVFLLRCKPEESAVLLTKKGLGL